MKIDDPTRLRHMLHAALEAVSFLGNLDAGGLTENRLALIEKLKKLIDG